MVEATEPRNEFRENVHGLTLLECLIAIALSAIIFFSSVMAYRQLVERHELTTLVDHLMSALQYARYTAMTTQATITFCPKGKNDQCGTHWQAGQLIMDQKSQHVFRELPPMPKNECLFWRSTLGESNALRWRADGFTRGQQGSFFIESKKKSQTLFAKIIILRTGRLRSEVGRWGSVIGCR